MDDYPRYESYDPIRLATMTEGLVCQNSARKYTDFYCAGVYGGISTGYAAGCCLRCVFCWVDFSRDFPERLANLTPPQEMRADELLRAGEYLETLGPVWEPATPQERKEIYQLVLEVVVVDVLEKKLVKVVPKGAFAPLSANGH